MEPQRGSKPPAQELVGQSPPSPTREVDACQRPRGRGHGTLGFWGLTRPAELVAGPSPDSLATERGRSVRDSTRADPASEALPVAPRAELASSNQVPVTHVARKAQMHLEPAPARIGRRAGGTKCPDRRREELLRAQRGCQATTESDMGAHRAPEVARPAGGALRSPVAAVRSPSTGAALESRLCLPAS